MSGGTTIQITGLEELKKKFKGLPANVEAGIDAELDTVANEYQNRAHNAAPTDRGQLRTQITAAKTGELSYEVASHAPYSAYVEFGTRSRVQVPSGLAAYAAQFRSKGAKGDAKKAIYDWCKRVGIPKEAWYPIFIKIMTVGTNPHPFFFIHLNWAQAEVQKRAQKVVKNALK